MNNKAFEYRGYTGSVEVDTKSEVLFGKILFINDLVTYQALTLADLKREFEEAVEDYLSTCEELGESPDKPMSGVFNVRISPELHRKVAALAIGGGESLNEFVKTSIQQRVEGIAVATEITHTHIHKIEGDISSTAKAGFSSAIISEDIFGDSESEATFELTQH